MRRKRQLVGVVGCGSSGSGVGTVLDCLTLPGRADPATSSSSCEEAIETK